MKIEILFASLVAVLLFGLHWAATRALNITLKPFVNLMIRFCMPSFMYRFLTQ